MGILRYAAGGAVLSVLIGVVLIMALSALTDAAAELVVALYILALPGVCAGGCYGLYAARKGEPDQGGETDKPS